MEYTEKLEIKRTLEFLQQHWAGLTTNQQNFIVSVRKFYKAKGMLSPKQKTILNELKRPFESPGDHRQ